MIEGAAPIDQPVATTEDVRSRFAEARRRGQPAWLWPEVSPGAWRAALAEIERVTSSIVRGEPASSPLQGSAPALGLAGYTSGMGPLLGYWGSRGMLSAAPPAAELLDIHLRQNERRMAHLSEVLASTLERFRAAGIEPIVLKGMHTAFEYLPAPATRPVSDIDLLVEPAEAEEAGRALRAAGYQERARQHRPYRADWVPLGTPDLPRSVWFTHADDPFSIDLHASLDRNFFGVARVEFDRVRSLPDRLGTLDRRRSNTPPSSEAEAGKSNADAGPVPRVLPQPLLTLLLATHASEGLHSLSLVRLVELTLVIEKDRQRGRIDWDELAAMASTTGALRFAFPAFTLADRLSPGLIPPAVLSRCRDAATTAMRRVVDRLTPATAQRIDRPLSLEERTMWAGSPTETLLRIAHGAWPAPAGRSLRRLGAIYRDRAWRIIRGAIER